MSIFSRLFSLPLCCFVFTSCKSPSVTSIDEPLGKQTSSPYSLQYIFIDQYSCSPQKSFTDYGGRDVWLSLAGYKISPQTLDHWKTNDGKVLRQFSSDGCSASPDGPLISAPNKEWTQCCVKHDIDYWVGGSLEEKEMADLNLERCIGDQGFVEVGKVYNFFVKRFGGTENNTTFRWGYGWNYIRDYGQLTTAELDYIQNEYKMSLSALKKDLGASFISLTNMCDTYDRGTSQLSPHETNIYRYLNKKIKSDDWIEWAKITRRTHSTQQYEVKILSCDSPLIFSFKDNEIIDILMDKKCLGLFKN